MFDWTLAAFFGLSLLLVGGRSLPGLSAFGIRSGRKVFNTLDPPMIARRVQAHVPLVLLTACIIVLAAFTARSPLPENTVTLPVEVYPSDGRSQTTETISLSASNGSATDRLYFQMHQPFYHRGGWETSVGNGFDPETMVDVRLNGGSWVAVRDENVTCASIEEDYGCIGGAYSTVRFSMGASALGGAVDGENVVEFRFNGTEGVRSGFRVIAIGFMRSGDDVDSFIPLPEPDATESLIDGTTIKKSDPDNWTAPSDYDDSQSVSDGEALWRNENSLTDLDGTDIVAGCASCHATDGRDLQYFAYSNKTIVARSQAHGLSESEGKKIAAYIRSLDFTNTNGSAVATNSPGRPWNPPYQPGPTGFGSDSNQHPDEADPFYWAAGAGLDWVLDDHKNVTQHAFPASGDPANPNGVKLTSSGRLHWGRYKLNDTSEWGGNGGTDRGTAINMREIPLSVQLPDWNNWLPDVHPHDGMEKLFDGSDTESLFDDGESTFSSGDLGSIESFLDNANGYVDQEIKSTVKNENDPSIGTSNDLTGPQWEHAITSVVQWRATKIWYLQHRYEVEDKADDYYCDGSANEWCEPLGWMGTVRAAFDIAPHVSGVGSDEPRVYGTGQRNSFYSHVWYQLQMVVNPGTPGSGGQVPVDEGYQEAYMAGACNAYDVPCGLRQVISEWKFWQLMSNDIQGTEGPIPGNVSLDHILNVVKTGDRKNKIWDRLTETSEGKYHARLWIEGLFRAVNAYMVGENGNEGRIATVDRLSDATFDEGGFKWNGIDYNPDLDSYHDKDYAAQIYWALSGNLYEQEDSLTAFFPEMSRGTLDSLAAQGDLLAPDNRDDGYTGEVVNDWPDQTRWHDLVAYTGDESDGGDGSDGSGSDTTETSVSQGISLQPGWNVISSHVAPDSKEMDSVFVNVSIGVVKDEDGNVFVPAENRDEIGVWDSTSAYKVYTEAGQTLTITGSAVADTAAIPLQKGWNLVPYRPTDALPVDVALESIHSELVIVKNETGETYVPAHGINDIGQMNPTEGYQVYVEAPVNLIYPTDTSGSSTKTVSVFNREAPRD